MRIIRPFLTLFVGGFSLFGYTQCPAGQVMVTIDVQTDAFGFECFWDLENVGNACGIAPLGTYGNTVEMNCNSGGSQTATIGNGYYNNIIVTETIGCMAIGTCLDINYVDDYGDGPFLCQNERSYPTYLSLQWNRN